MQPVSLMEWLCAPRVTTWPKWHMVIHKLSSLSWRHRTTN